MQMDINGHTPIPLAQNNCPLWQFPSYFYAVFWVPKFQMVSIGMHLVIVEIFKYRIDLSNEILSPQIGDRMQKL